MANPWMSRENIAGYPTLVLPTQFSLERGLYMRMTMHCAQTRSENMSRSRSATSHGHSHGSQGHGSAAGGQTQGQGHSYTTSTLTCFYHRFVIGSAVSK